MFGGCVTLFGVRGEDVKRFVIEVAYYIYGKKYVQQVDVEEETIQPSDAGRQRCLGSHPKIQPGMQ